VGGGNLNFWRANCFGRDRLSGLQRRPCARRGVATGLWPVTSVSSPNERTAHRAVATAAFNSRYVLRPGSCLSWLRGGAFLRGSRYSSQLGHSLTRSADWNWSTTMRSVSSRLSGLLFCRHGRCIFPPFFSTVAAADSTDFLSVLARGRGLS
jgi:hypothetical protein